jgi:hypothetical protein
VKKKSMGVKGSEEKGREGKQRGRLSARTEENQQWILGAV